MHGTWVFIFDSVLKMLKEDTLAQNLKIRVELLKDEIKIQGDIALQ
jgi:hypothetical protein